VVIVLGVMRRWRGEGGRVDVDVLGRFRGIMEGDVELGVVDDPPKVAGDPGLGDNAEPDRLPIVLFALLLPLLLEDLPILQGKFQSDWYLTSSMPMVSCSNIAGSNTRSIRRSASKMTICTMSKITASIFNCWKSVASLSPGSLRRKCNRTLMLEIQ